MYSEGQERKDRKFLGKGCDLPSTVIESWRRQTGALIDSSGGSDCTYSEDLGSGVLWWYFLAWYCTGLNALSGVSPVLEVETEALVAPRASGTNL